MVPPLPDFGTASEPDAEDPNQMELIMMLERRGACALYVDRFSQRWIVRDSEGTYWTVPATEADAWDHREPFHPTEETELEPVPGHYKAMLGLPI